LGFLGLLGIRKRRKLCAGLMVVCVIVGAAGCALPPTTILVTATPTDKTTPPQTMQIDVAK
jgi:uncharacterized lipoprotein YajG